MRCWIAQRRLEGVNVENIGEAINDGGHGDRKL